MEDVLKRQGLSRTIVAAVAVALMGLGSATFSLASGSSAQAQEVDAQNQQASITWDRRSDQQETQPIDDLFYYSGEVSCLETHIAEGCADMVFTVPLPEQQMPDGAIPFSEWQSWFYWSATDQWIDGGLNDEGTAWQFQIPSALPGGETAEYQFAVYADSMFAPSSHTFTLQPTLSGSNFQSVTAANPVQFTATAELPDAEPRLKRVSPANGTVLPGGQVSYQISSIWAEAGTGNGNAAPMPGTMDITVFLPDNTSFVSAEEDGAISGQYDADTNTVVFPGVGLTWQQVKQGITQNFAPVVFQLQPGFQNDIFGNSVDASLTSGVIGAAGETYTSDVYTSSDRFTMKTTVSGSDVFSVGTGATTGFYGNRFDTASAPLPLFGGQSSWSLVMAPIALPYDLEGQWAVPCRSGSSPNVTIKGDAACEEQNIAFLPQSVYLDTDDPDLSLQATVTYAGNGDTPNTQDITITKTATELRGSISSINFSGTMGEDQGATLMILGQFPEGAMDGTPVANDSTDIHFQAAAGWSAKATKSGTTLPTSYDFVSQAGHPIILSTGSSVRHGTTVTPTGAEAKFATIVDDQAGVVEAAILLPPGVEYQGWTASDAEPSFEPQVTENWNGTGATLLNFQWDGSQDQFVDSGDIAWAQPTSPGHYPVTFMVNAGNNPFTGEKCWDGQNASNPYSTFSTYSPTSGGLLDNDANGVCAATLYFDVSGLNATLIEGFVKSADSPVWMPSPGLRWASEANPVGIQPGTEAELMATASNLALGNVDNPLVCVSVPNVQDNNPITGKTLNNDYSMALAGAPTVPDGWSVQYSTDSGACESQFSESAAAQWTDDLPSDLGGVRAMKFQTDSLASGQSASFVYPVLLPVLEDGYENQVSWAMPALSYDGATEEGAVATHATLVGIGDIERFNPWYGSISAQVVDQDRAWARSGDTVRFTETVTVADDGFLAPYVALTMSVPTADGVTFTEGSIQASTGTPVYDNTTGLITWNLGNAEPGEATISYDVVLGDTPPSHVESSVQATDESKPQTCPEGATCSTVAAMSVPQTAVSLSTTPGSGEVLVAGDKVDFDLTLSTSDIAFDAAALAVFNPTVTWDVADLQKHGTIEVESTSVGTAVYDKDAGTVTWTDLHWSVPEGAPMAIAASDASVTGQFKATFTAADSVAAAVVAAQTEVGTGFAVQVGDQFTPAIGLTALDANFAIEAGSEPELKAGTVQIQNMDGQAVQRAKVGQELVAAPLDWPESTEFSYQWYLMDAKTHKAVLLDGVTGSTVKVLPEWAGKELVMQLTGKIDETWSKTVLSQTVSIPAGSGTGAGTGTGTGTGASAGGLAHTGLALNVVLLSLGAFFLMAGVAINTKRRSRL